MDRRRRTIEAIKIECHDGREYFALDDAEVRRFARRYAAAEGERIVREFRCPEFLVRALTVVRIDPRTLAIVRRWPDQRRFFE